MYYEMPVIPTCTISLFRVTGYLAMKVGKAAAIAVGGGIIILQIASHKGYINVNWDKVQGKVNKVADKIEKKATGKGPSWLDKVNENIHYQKFLYLELSNVNRTLVSHVNTNIGFYLLSCMSPPFELSF